MFVFSVTRRKTVSSRDFCCLSAIFVVSCSDFLTRFQNSVDWNMLSPFQMLENEGLNLSQKRRDLLHMNRCKRAPHTDSCSRKADEMVAKGQWTQAKASSCHCNLCIPMSLPVLRGRGVSCSSERVTRILETKTTARAYLERKKTLLFILFYFFLAACLFLL